MKWRVGDVAIAQNCLRQTHLNGQECTITGTTNRKDKYIWLVDVNGCPSKHETRLWSFSNNHLKPLPDDNQASTWEAVDKCCGWQPKELVI